MREIYVMWLSSDGRSHSFPFLFIFLPDKEILKAVSCFAGRVADRSELGSGRPQWGTHTRPTTRRRKSTHAMTHDFSR
eukprot:g69010.t1